MEAVRANNPNLSKSKQNKKARETKYGIQTRGKSTQINSPLTSGNSNHIGKDYNKLISGLVAELLLMLQRNS